MRTNVSGTLGTVRHHQHHHHHPPHHSHPSLYTSKPLHSSPFPDCRLCTPVTRLAVWLELILISAGTVGPFAQLKKKKKKGIQPNSTSKTLSVVCEAQSDKNRKTMGHGRRAELVLMSFVFYFGVVSFSL